MAHVQTPGFWEIGCFKNNVRRIKDGIDQLEDYSKMLKERADLEAKYIKSLNMFTEKWRNHSIDITTDSSIRTAWQGIISEADSLASVHDDVRRNLVEKVVKDISSFRKENYHISAFRAPKECREIEDEFEKAQRHWKKIHDKMENYKKQYHNACSMEKTAEVAVQNSKADTSISQDTAQKLQDRLKKCKEETRKTREDYQRILNELTQYRTPYIESMTFVFEKCQANELNRCNFFIDQMKSTEIILSELINNDKFVHHHNELDKTLRSLDSTALTADMIKWSKRNGVEAPTKWPEFEDYSPEMRNISGRNTNSKKNTDEVVLMKQTIKSDDIVSKTHVEASRQNSAQSNGWNQTADNNSTDEIPSENRPISANSSDRDSAKHSDYNDCFAYTKIPAYRTPLPINKSNGNSSATALYDYTSVESDEISLEKGEIIELLSPPDSLGWCTGRKPNGESGLFPFSYVQVA